jgi:hypothetical protein
MRLKLCPLGAAPEKLDWSTSCPFPLKSDNAPSLFLASASSPRVEAQDIRPQLCDSLKAKIVFRFLSRASGRLNSLMSCHY